ncbi:MAG: hypothetical protein M3Q30_14005 [Actinomycetota bacterium]|nr:hypothetical protein [Actinomycetota bacterium]
MLYEERSIDTNTGSEDVDDNDGPTVTVRSAGEDRDVTAATASAMSRMAPPDVEGRKRGRPTKLTPETQEKLRAGVAAGIPIELTARSVGVGASTVHGWREIGERALATRSEDQVLSDRERACLDLVIVLREAEAEYFAGLQAMLVTAATNHRKTTTTHSYTYKIVRNEILRDEHGEPELVPTYTTAVTEEPDVRAIIALHKHALEQASKTDRYEPRTDPADDARELAGITALEMRLAAGIHVVREQMHEDWDDVVEERVDRRLQAIGTPPTSAAAASDNDGDDYEYALWESALYAEVTPETPETPPTDAST